MPIARVTVTNAVRMQGHLVPQVLNVTQTARKFLEEPLEQRYSERVACITREARSRVESSQAKDRLNEQYRRALLATRQVARLFLWCESERMNGGVLQGLSSHPLWNGRSKLGAPFLAACQEQAGLHFKPRFRATERRLLYRQCTSHDWIDVTYVLPANWGKQLTAFLREQMKLAPSERDPRMLISVESQLGEFKHLIRAMRSRASEEELKPLPFLVE